MLMKTALRPLLGLIAILFAGEFLPAPVLADSASIARTLRVDVSDLDLARPYDRHILQRRIEKAAQIVCGPEPFMVTPDPPGYLGYETCYRRAVASARVRNGALVSCIANHQPAAASCTADSVQYPENFQRWVHVRTGVLMPGANPQLASEEGMRHIFANSKAVGGYASGDFADGSIIVYELRAVQQQKNGVIFEGARQRVDVMIKDASLYGKTGGWRFERFWGNNQTQNVLDDSGRSCFACHSKANARGYVFSQLQ